MASVTSFAGNNPSHPPAPCSPRHAGRAGGEWEVGCVRAAQPPAHTLIPQFPLPTPPSGVGRGRGGGAIPKMQTTPVNRHDSGLAKSEDLNRVALNQTLLLVTHHHHRQLRGELERRDGNRLRGLRHSGRGAQCRIERSCVGQALCGRRIERRCGIVHWNRDPGFELSNDFCRAFAIEGEESAHRNHHHIHLADLLDLIVTEFVPQVAEMRQAQAIHIENEDGILAARRTLRIVVVRGHGGDAYAFDRLVNLCPIVAGETAQNRRVACCERDVVVIGVLVADGDKVYAADRCERVTHRRRHRVEERGQAATRFENERRMPEPGERDGHFFWWCCCGHGRRGWENARCGRRNRGRGGWHRCRRRWCGRCGWRNARRGWGHRCWAGSSACRESESQNDKQEQFFHCLFLNLNVFFA